MMHGYGLVKKLSAELKDFMKAHNFSSIEDFRGCALLFRTNFMNKTTSGIWKFTRFHVFGGFPGFLFSILQLTRIWYKGNKKLLNRGKL